MKKFSIFPRGYTTSLLVPIFLLCQSSNSFSQVNVNEQKEGLEPGDKRTGDTQLLSLARRFKMDVLIDSSNKANSYFAEAMSQRARGSATDPVSALVSCAQDYHMSSRQLASGPLLFWDEPDQKETAAGFANGGGLGVEHDGLSPELLISQILKHFANGDQGEVRTEIGLKDQPVAKNFSLNQLPEELQQEVTAQILSRGRGEVSRDYIELWFSPLAWQRAQIVYSPADPTMGGSYQTLILQILLETPSQERFLVSLDTFEGGGGATKIKGAKVESIAEKDSLRILSNDKIPNAPPSVVLQEVLRPKGNSLKAVKASGVGDLRELADSNPKITIEASNEPVEKFLSRVSALANVQLALPVDEKPTLALSAHIQDLPLTELMSSLSQLFGRRWTRIQEKSFEFSSSAELLSQNKVRQLGYFPWYKFREVNTDSRERRKVDFEAFASRVVDEAGPNIMTKPGVPVSSLPEEVQKELKERVSWGLTRQMLLRQSMRQDLLSGEWTFQLAAPRYSQENPSLQGAELNLLVGGKRSASIRLPLNLRRNMTIPEG